jgi:hypothetical protein
VLSCVQVAALRQADILPTVWKHQETEKVAKAHKGCRAIDIQTNVELWIGGDVEGISHGLQPGICLVGLRKTTKKLSQ